MKIITKTKITVLLFIIISNSLNAQELKSILKPVQDETMPKWFNYFKNGTQNIFKIDSAYSAYYRKNKFVKSKYTRYYKKWRFAVQPSIKPNGFIDSTFINTSSIFSRSTLAKPTVQITKRQSYLKTNSNLGNWTAIGPKYISNPPYSDKYNAHINVYYLEISASDPNIVYAATEGNSIFKTVDKGISWNAVDQTNPIVSTGPIAIHPSNPDIVYIAASSNIIKTTDGGLSWTIVKNLPNGFCEDLKIDPSNPNRIYAASDKGLYVSLDAGATWNQKTNGYIWSVQIDPLNSNKVFMYQTVNGLTNLYKSTDYGQTFSLKNSGWHTGNADCGLISIAKSNPNIIYAGSLVYNENKLKLMKSTDNGETWALVSQPAGSWQGFYDFALAVSPSDPNKVLTGTIELLYSADGGTSFKQASSLHTDIQDIKTMGNDTWVSNDGGIAYSSDFFSSNTNYSVMDDGISDNEFWGFGQGWNNDVMGGGRYHDGNVIIDQDNNPNHGFYSGGAEEGTGYILPFNEDLVLFSSAGAVSVSTHQTGGYGTYPNEDGYGFNASELENDPTLTSTHYLGRENYLYKSTNTGTSFSKVPSDTQPFDFGSSTRHFEIFRNNPKIIYVSTYESLWKTIDGGLNWSEITRPISGSVYTTISLSFENENILWANFGNTVYKTLDGGLTWQNLSTATLFNGNIRQVIQQAGTNGGVYILMDPSKIYYRDNTLSDWVEYTNNLPVNFYFLKGIIFYRDNKLRVAGNHGIWESALYKPSSSVAQIMANKTVVGCAENIVQFTSYSVANSNSSYLWTFSGGNPQTSTSKNVSVSYSQVGKYDVSLKVTNPDGSSHTQSFSNFIEYIDIDCKPSCNIGKALTTSNWSFISMPKPNLGNTNTLSISMWINPSSISTSLPSALLANSMAGFGLALNNTNNELIGIWNNSKTYSGVNIPTNAWSHIAWVVSPSKQAFYVNDVEYVVSTTNNSFDFSPFYINTLGLGWEGFNMPFGQTLNNFEGSMDEIKIYNTALTLSEVKLSKFMLNSLSSNLVAYVQFNELSDNLTYNLVGQTSFSTIDLAKKSIKNTSTAPLSCLNYLKLHLKAYLQGAFYGITDPSGLMRDDLRSQNLIPLVSPYDSVSQTTTSVLALTGNNAIVDWINIELRDSTNNTNIIESKSALLQRDGDIVDVDGVSELGFNTNLPALNYIAIKHRNHLPILSKNPLSVSINPGTLDFTSSNTALYKLSNSSVDIPTVSLVQGQALWSSNVLNDKSVIYQGSQNDVENIHGLIINASGNIFKSLNYRLKTYNSGDINMDGETIFQGTSNDPDFIYQNVLKVNTGNFLKLPNFIIKAQLP